MENSRGEATVNQIVCDCECSLQPFVEDFYKYKGRLRNKITEYMSKKVFTLYSVTPR